MTKSSTYTENLRSFLGAIPDATDKSNAGPILAEIYKWQEACDYAKKRLEAAWKEAQAKGGVVPADDDIRDMEPGEHIIAKGKVFACFVKLNNPSNRFDKETFIRKLSKKYKISIDDLEALAKVSTIEAKGQLTKKIIETA